MDTLKAHQIWCPHCKSEGKVSLIEVYIDWRLFLKESPTAGALWDPNCRVCKSPIGLGDVEVGLCENADSLHIPLEDLDRLLDATPQVNGHPPLPPTPTQKRRARRQRRDERVKQIQINRAYQAYRQEQQEGGDAELAPPSAPGPGVEVPSAEAELPAVESNSQPTPDTEETTMAEGIPSPESRKPNSSADNLPVPQQPSLLGYVWNTAWTLGGGFMFLLGAATFWLTTKALASWAGDDEDQE